MADQPQTTLSEVITSTTEEKKTEPSPEQNIQAACAIVNELRDCRLHI